MRLRAGRQIRCSLKAHLVFVTKCAGPVFTRAVLDELRGMFADVCRGFGAELAFCGGGTDWVRLAVVYPPGVELPVLINSLKTVSSRLIRKAAHPEVQQAVALAGGALWSPSYLAAAGDAQEVEEMVLNFIDDQGGGAMV